MTVVLTEEQMAAANAALAEETGLVSQRIAEAGASDCCPVAAEHAARREYCGLSPRKSPAQLIAEKMAEAKAAT